MVDPFAGYAAIQSTDGLLGQVIRISDASSRLPVTPQSKLEARVDPESGATDRYCIVDERGSIRQRWNNDRVHHAFGIGPG